MGRFFLELGAIILQSFTNGSFLTAVATIMLYGVTQDTPYDMMTSAFIFSHYFRQKKSSTRSA
jgi:hypothetical protein